MTIIKCRFCMGEERAAEDTDYVEKILPPGYSHLLCRHELLEKLEDMENFRASLKLQMTTEEQVQKWLEDFQKTSALTWRKSRTYPDSGRYNKYRSRDKIYLDRAVKTNPFEETALQVDLRCHHKTYSASSKTSKNTNCPATMFLILKRSMHERKSRSGDPHIEEGYFLHVNLRNEHNHRLHTAEVMRWRDVSNDTIEKLQQLYKSGHSPSSALKTIKYNLQEEEGDNYLYAVTDRSICPDIQFCYRLYYKLFPKSFAEPAEKDISEELFRPLELEQSWETMTVTDGQATFNEETVSVTTVPIITTTEGEHFTQEPVHEPGPSTAVAETVGTLDGQLEDVFGILKKKLNEDASFTPSIRAFVSNFYQLKNDSALQSSLFCFGKVAEIISQISVQPAAGPRKKGAGRRAVGRPPKNSRREHPYCNSRTEDAPPTLTFCLQETNTLEKTDEPQTAASGGCTDPITVALQGTLETNS